MIEQMLVQEAMSMVYYQTILLCQEIVFEPSWKRGVLLGRPQGGINLVLP
jgi:hypothetical protein